jgi:hypothetical protein
MACGLLDHGPEAEAGREGERGRRIRTGEHMNRATILPTIAALAAACAPYHSEPPPPPPCDSRLQLYWTPSPTPPNAGFQVPGLAAAGFAAQLGCLDAGVDAVRVTVAGVVQECTTPGFCRGVDWLCATEGIEVPIAPGTYPVQLDAVDAFGGIKYQGVADVTVACDGATQVGIFPQGVAGPLDLAYSFGDGGDLCGAGSYLWFLVTRTTDAGTAVFDVVDDRNQPLAVPCTNLAAQRSIGLVAPGGGPSVPPGVYTRARFEEVVPAGGSYAPVRANCTTETIVHAGAESWPVVAVASGSLCP